MKTLREKILALRDDGCPFSEISRQLGCSKSVVCYYCTPGQLEKNRTRTQRRRKDNSLIKKIETFKGKNRKRLRDKTRDFQRRIGSKNKSKAIISFNCNDVLQKFGDTPKCYLTGRIIDLMESKSYSLDHVIPATKGGPNSLDNLGLVCRQANMAKSDMTLTEFIALCKEILENNGYAVSESKSDKRADSASKTDGTPE